MLYIMLILSANYTKPASTS